MNSLSDWSDKKYWQKLLEVIKDSNKLIPAVQLWRVLFFYKCKSRINVLQFCKQVIKEKYNKYILEIKP